MNLTQQRVKLLTLNEHIKQLLGDWIKRILLLESGSFLTVGGAIIDTYNMYRGFNKAGKYKVDIYADLSKIDKNVKALSYEKMFLQKYDFVFLNSIRDVPIAMKYKRKMGRMTKYLYVDRGNVLVNFSKAGMKRLLPKMIIRYLYTIFLIRLLDYYVAITAEQYKFAKTFFNLRKTKVSYINIAAHKEFRKLNIRKAYTGALYVGRLDERQKKVNFLIRGIAETVKRYPGLKEKELLKIVGEGPDEENYKSLSSSLGLEKNIQFIGFIREEKLVRAYNNCGFLVSTSEWESPGRIFLEAMATITKRMLAQKEYDFVYVCFTETDRIQHFVMGKKERDEYLVPVYRAIGDFVSYILSRVEKEDAAFAIVSDHGAREVKEKFLMNAWLINNGYIKLKSAIASKVADSKPQGSMRYRLRERLIRNSNLRKTYDGLPYGIKKLAFKSFGAVFSGVSARESRLHLFDFDMRRTKAFAAISNNPVATIWINDGRFTNGIVSGKDKGMVKAELRKRLEAVKSPEGDRLFTEVYDGRSYYGNTKKFIAPDLLVQAKEGYTLDIFNFSARSLYSKPEGAKSGDHLRYGIFGFYSKRKEVEIQNLALEDVAKIILDYFGVGKKER